MEENARRHAEHQAVGSLDLWERDEPNRDGHKGDGCRRKRQQPP
jgi:hypothetical protein